MLENLKGKRVLLASNSPRRRELLKEMGVDFEVIVKEGVDESIPDNIDPKEAAEYASAKKAGAYMEDLKEDDVLITADTIVLIDSHIMGKPADEEQACRMLRQLSGRTHRVITGVTIATTAGTVSFSVKTKVTMRQLTDEIVEHYVKTYHPTDKAGAYGIQEWIGAVGIDYIEGSFQNVMGLPTQRLFAELAKI